MSANVTVNSDSTGLEPPIESEGWCTTKKAEDVHFKFVWTIVNFRRELENTGIGISNYMYSSEFSILSPDDVQTKWRLLLYPNGEKAENAGNLSLYICNQIDQEIRCVYRIKLSILDASKKEVLTWSPNTRIVFPSRTSKKNARGINLYISHEELLQGPSTAAAAELLPQDKLTIVCDMTLSGVKKTDVSGSKQLQDAKKKKKSAEQLIPDYEFALNDKDFSDVKIVCGDRVFDCHRIILSTRSPVFRAMFQNGMTEARTKRVEIKELEPAVVQAMLEYIYTGKMKFSSIKSEDMLAAAQMYDLRSLKDFNEENLCKRLDIRNCIEMLVLGDLHEAAALKRDAMKLIVLNLRSVVNSQDWQEKLIRYPVLVTEVMKNVGEMTPEPPKKRARK